MALVVHVIDVVIAECLLHSLSNTVMAQDPLCMTIHFSMVIFLPTLWSSGGFKDLSPENLSNC